MTYGEDKRTDRPVVFRSVELQCSSAVPQCNISSMQNNGRIAPDLIAESVLTPTQAVWYIQCF